MLPILSEMQGIDTYPKDDPREIRWAVSEIIDGKESYLNTDMTYTTSIDSNNLLLFDCQKEYTLNRHQIFVAVVCNPPIGNSKQWRPSWIAYKCDEQHYKDKEEYNNMNSYYVLKDNNGYLKSFDFGGTDKAKTVMTKDINCAYRFDVNCTAYQDHSVLFEGLQITPVKLVGKPKNFQVVDLQDEAKEKGTKQIDKHYKQLPIQPFEYSYKNKLDPLQHTIIKYVTRFRDKNGLRDLLAAKQTIDILISFEYIDNK